MQVVSSPCPRVWYLYMRLATLINLAMICTIKGTVLRDHGWDKASEYKSRPKLRFANPFFPFKNRPLQSYGPQSIASIDVKSGLSDSADFAPTQIPIRIVSVAYPGTNFANCSCSHDQSLKYQVRGSFFTPNSRKSRLSHFLETAIVRNWQFAVKRSPIATA
jgi:hypothetical protein